MAVVGGSASSLDVRNEISKEKQSQEESASPIEAKQGVIPDEPIEEQLPIAVNSDLIQETKRLRDTLDLLWNQTVEQRNLCHELERENEYLQEYIGNLMTSSNVLEK